MHGLWVAGLVWVLGATAAIALPQSVRSPLQLAQASADSPQKQEADQLFQQGIQQFQTSQFRAAIQSWEAALQRYRNIQNRQGEANALNNLGIAYASLGQYQQAINSCQQSLTTSREISHQRGEAASLGNLGIIYSSLGQYQQAIDFHQQSLAIKREIGDRLGESNSLGSLGLAYEALGQHQQAIDVHQQSLGIAREIGYRRGEAIALSNLGNVYNLIGEYQQAINFHQQSLAIQREISNREGEANALGNLSNAYYSLRQYQQAINLHQQSLEIQREIGDREGEAISLTNLGLSYFEINRLAESFAAFQASLEIYEAIQQDVGSNDRDRTSLLETQQTAYQGLQRTLTMLNQDSKALEVADRGRARSLLSFLRSNHQLPSQPLTAAEIQAIAQQQKGTIVLYSVVWEALYIWVVPPAGNIILRRISLPNSANGLAQTSEELRNSAVTLRLIATRGNQRELTNFTNQLRGDNQQPITTNPTNLRQGYGLLIKPIADLLPTAPGSKLIIIPHRELALVPFTTLQDEQGKFLIDRYTLAFAPSVSVLAEAARRPKTSNGPALIVGNPNPMPDNLRPLPGSEKEAQAIAQTLNAKPLIGSQATEAKVKEQIDQASLLHFATHGILPRTAAAGLDSWLALAPSGDEDGQLTISEIFDRNLKAQLAVLSACDTGRGAVSGEGVIGLARAFLKAGVPTVVASLWKVPDEPTALMMQIFYAERAAGKDAATALRVAMLKVKEQYPGPQNWAAFVAIGDTN